MVGYLTDAAAAAHVKVLPSKEIVALDEALGGPREDDFTRKAIAEGEVGRPAGGRNLRTFVVGQM